MTPTQSRRWTWRLPLHLMKKFTTNGVWFRCQVSAVLPRSSTTKPFSLCYKTLYFYFNDRGYMYDILIQTHINMSICNIYAWDLSFGGYSSNASNRQGYASLRSVARNSIWVSHSNNGNTSAWVIIRCLPDTLAGSWSSKVLNQHSDMQVLHVSA